MGTLEGKVAIVSGSGRGIGREIALKLAGEGAQGGGQRPRRRTRQGDGRRDRGRGRAGRGLRRQRHRHRLRRTLRRGRGRQLRRAGHHRQQRRLHLGLGDPEDDRRAVGRDPRRAPQGAVPDPAGRAARHRCRGQESQSRRGACPLPQGGQHLLARRDRWQCRTGELLVGEGRGHGSDQGAGQGVGALQRHRQHGGVRADQDPAHRDPGRRRRHDIDVAGNEIKVGVNPSLLAAMEQMVPLGRGGTPAEAAGAVYLFCLPESDYVSAQTLVCGGGFSF